MCNVIQFHNGAQPDGYAILPSQSPHLIIRPHGGCLYNGMMGARQQTTAAAESLQRMSAIITGSTTYTDPSLLTDRKYVKMSKPV